MILDISNIVRNNSLFSIKYRTTLETAINILSIKYEIENDFKNDIITIIFDDVQISFNSKIFWYGMIKFWNHTEVFCFNEKLTERTTLSEIRNIFNSNGICFKETEVFMNDQLNMELENGAVFYFNFNAFNQYCLAQIQWS